MKPILRASAAGVLAVALVSGMSAAPSFAATEAVTGVGLLAAPTGLTPDDSTAPFPHAVLKTVKLDWAPVSGATGYRVQVGRDSTWSDAPVLSQDVVPSEYTLPVWLPHATYVWRVAALKGSTLGHWSSEQGDLHSEAQFTRGWRDAPTPVAPSGAVGARPEFSWTPVPYASAYEVQVSDTDFGVQSSTSTPDTSPSPSTQYQASGAVDTCFTQRTRVTFFTRSVEHGEVNSGPCTSTLLGNGAQRYWRVRALDGYTGTGADVETSPAAGGVSDLKPTGTPDPNLALDCPGDTGGGCTPSYASEFGPWSATTLFTSTAVAPVGTFDPTALVPTLTLANDPDHLCTVTNAGATEAEHAKCVDFPTIAWNAAPGAVRYRLTIATDDAMSNVQRIIDTGGLQWTPNDSWPDASGATSYYYVVQACDANQCGAVTSTPPSFAKVTPRPTLGAVPPVTGDFHLVWKSYAYMLRQATSQAEPEDAFAYHVQIATSAHPSYDATVFDGTVDQEYAAFGNDLGDGSFVWRVQAVDASGHKLPWSFSQAFTRDATPPKVSSVTPSSNVGDLQPLKVVFSEPVTGVSSSTLTLSPVASTVVAGTGDQMTFTLTPTAPLRPGASYTITVSPAVKDLSGNVAVAVGPVVTVSPLVDDTNKAVAYGGSWSVLSSSNAVGGHYHGSTPTSTSQTTAVVPFSGIGLYVYSCMGPSSGYLDVYVDNVKKVRVSLYRSYSGCGVRVAAVSGLVRGAHSLKVVGVGAHASGSTGNAVSLDAVLVTP